MTAARGSAARVVGLGFLVPGLLLAQPLGAVAESKSPPKSTPARQAKPQKVATVRPTAKPVTGRCLHVVKRGESLGAIALKYRVSRNALSTGNNVSNPNALRAGQRLRIPGCRESDPREPESVAISGDKSQVLARVGPRRIPTRLHLAMPEFSGDEGVSFEWPVEGSVVSGFGQRRRGWHAGIDIMADPGTPIRASARGTVIFSGYERYYGASHQDRACRWIHLALRPQP